MTYRIITAAITKSLVPRNECLGGCRTGAQKHIHREDLYKPHEQMYWQIDATRLPDYKRALVLAMENKWAAEGLEPVQEIVFKDGKTEFRAVSLCYQRKGIIKKIKGLVEPKLTPEQARSIMLKHLQEWEIQAA